MPPHNKGAIFCPVRRGKRHISSPVLRLSARALWDVETKTRSPAVLTACTFSFVSTDYNAAGGCGAEGERRDEESKEYPPAATTNKVAAMHIASKATVAKVTMSLGENRIVLSCCFHLGIGRFIPARGHGVEFVVASGRTKRAVVSRPNTSPSSINGAGQSGEFVTKRHLRL